VNPAERIGDRKGQEKHAASLEAGLHPDARLREILGGDKKAWARFNLEPIDFDYWMMWAQHFDRLFREHMDINQTRPIFVELHRRSFTNLMLRTACEHIISRCRKWPFVADFLEGIKDSNEQV
jgi:hypothetical protein